MSKIGFEERINSLKEELLRVGFNPEVFKTLNTVWKPSEKDMYYILSWSGYLEKLIEKGVGNHVKIPDQEGKNACNVVNPYSKKTAVFNCSNWNDIKTSGFFKEFIPPAVLITNDRQLLTHNQQLIEAYNHLQGTLIICKRDKRDNLETSVYMVGQNKLPSKRISFRELFADCLADNDEAISG